METGTERTPVRERALALGRGVVVAGGTLVAAGAVLLDTQKLLDELLGSRILLLIPALVIFSLTVPQVIPEPDRRSGWGRALVVSGIAVLLTASFLSRLPSVLFSWSAPIPQDHSPSGPGTVMLAGYGALAVGAWILVAGQRPSRPRPTETSVWAFWGGALTVVLLAASAVPLSLDRPMVHTTAEPGDPAPVPGSVTEVGWSWDPPKGVKVTGILSGPRGPLVTTYDGLVALDGETGEELWAYRRPHAWEVLAQVTKSGEFAAVGFVDEAGSADRVVLLDTATGEVLADTDAARRDSSYSVFYEAGLLFYQYRGKVRAHDPRTWERLWEFRAGTEAGGNCELASPVALGEVLFLGYHCVHSSPGRQDGEQAEEEEGQAPPPGSVEGVVVALDARTGEELWTRDWDWEFEIEEGDSPGDPGGLWLNVSGPTLLAGAERVLEVSFGREPRTAVIDPASGEDVVDLTEHVGVRLHGFDSETVYYQALDDGAETEFFGRWTADEGHVRAPESAREGWYREHDTVLEGQYLVTGFGEDDCDEEGPLRIRTVPFDEADQEGTVSVGRSTPSGCFVEHVVRVPGSVVVQPFSNGPLYGLVP